MRWYHMIFAILITITLAAVIYAALDTREHRKSESSWNREIVRMREELAAYERHISQPQVDTIILQAQRIIERIEVEKKQDEKEYQRSIDEPLSGDSLRSAIYSYHRENFPERYDMHPGSGNK